MGHTEHEQQAQAAVPQAIRCGILTISDTRTPTTDSSGSTTRTLLEAAEHTIAAYAIAPDEPAAIVAQVRAWAERCQVVITNGGTGITRRDSTFEAIDALLDKRLPGFGEIFRMLSYQEIGPAAMLSRATAGLYGATVIFCLPGSTGAVRLALEKLIIPQLPHLVWETIRQ